MARLSISREWSEHDRLHLSLEVDETARPEALATARLNLLDAYREAVGVTLAEESDTPPEASGG